MPFRRNDDGPTSTQDDQDAHMPSEPSDDTELSSQRHQTPIAVPADDDAPMSSQDDDDDELTAEEDDELTAEDDDELTAADKDELAAEDDDELISARGRDLPVSATADEPERSAKEDDMTSSEPDRDAPVLASKDDTWVNGRQDAEVASAVAAAELSEAVPPQSGAVPPQTGWVPPQPGPLSGEQLSAQPLRAESLPGEQLSAEPPRAEPLPGEPLPGMPPTGTESERGRTSAAAPGAHARGGQELSQQWHDIQAGFVDDPGLAVELAAQATAAALSALAADLQQRQSALSQTAAGDTEQMRAALQGYRDLCQDIEAAGRQLPQPSTAP